MAPTTPVAMSAPKTYQLAQMLGTGSYGLVFQATETKSGRAVALKKSRVSQRVKRPLLRYESRVLHLLQGHPAIPEIYGYGQLPHFEYLAMELLGPSINDCATGPVAVTTVARVVGQMLSALEHIHKRGFVHRDIKPDNMLCSSTDPAKVVLIDYGISTRIKPPPPSQYDPLKESRHIVGTINWASLNAFNGIDLAPRDDLESLAYTALFLLRGNLPWVSHKFRSRSVKFNIHRVREDKAAANGGNLGIDFPHEFSYLLDYSRGLAYDQTPDYTDLIRRFADLSGQARGIDAESPFDWNPVEISSNEGSGVAHRREDGRNRGGDGDADKSENEDGSEDEEDEDEGEGGDEDQENFSNSYFNWDIADWDKQGARDKDLTLPIDQTELADGGIAKIVDVTEEPDA